MSRFVILFLLMGSALWAGEDGDYRKASHLYTLKEYQLATDALNGFLKKYPKSERGDEAWILLGEASYQLKKFAAAGTAFDQYLARYPKGKRRMEALQRSVKVYYRNKQYKKSVARADTFLTDFLALLGAKEMPPAFPALLASVYYYAGDASFISKDLAGAKKYWEALERKLPKSKLLLDALEGLGWIAFEQKRYNDSGRAFGRVAASQTHTRSARSQLMLGRVQHKLGKHQEALATLQGVVSKKGGKELAREVMLFGARFNLDGKKYSQALIGYRGLVAKYAGHPESAIVLAQAANRLEQEQQAAMALELSELYLKSFKAGVDRAPMARVKVRALSALGKSKEVLLAAKVAVSEAEGLPPKAAKDQIPPALLLLAEHSGAAGKPFYERIIKEYGSSNSTYVLAARYQLAFLAWNKGEFKLALDNAEQLLKALEAGDGDAELRRKALFAAGDAAFQLERFSVAERHFVAYATLASVLANPKKMNLALVQLRLAWCRKKSGDSAGAVGLLGKALALTTTGEARWESMYLLVRSLIDLKELAKAQAQAEVLLKEAPESKFSAHTCFECAQVLYSSSKDEEAIAWLNSFSKIKLSSSLPIYSKAVFLRSKARYRKGLFSQALVDIEALLKRSDMKKDMDTLLLMKALCLESDGKRAVEAEAAFGVILEKGTGKASELLQARVRRGRLRFAAKNFKGAAEDFKAYLVAVPLATGKAETYEIAFRLAMCLRELKDGKGSAHWLQQLSKLPLKGVMGFEVPFQLGNTAYEGKDDKAAIAHYQKALDAAAKVAELPVEPKVAAWLNLAWACLRSGDKKQAEVALGKLIALDPAGPYAAEARFNRGRILAEIGDKQVAVALWTEILEKQGDSPLAEKAVAALGEMKAKAREFPAAIQFFRSYLKKYPKGKAVNEVRCGLGECLMQEKKWKEARTEFLAALGDKKLEDELDEMGERIVLGLAELALVQGMAAESKKLALRIVLDHPDSKWLDAALYLCAKGSEEMAAPDKAIAYYRQLITLRPKSPRVETAQERLKALGAPLKEAPK